MNRKTCLVFAIVLILLAGIAHAETIGPPKNANSAKECAICHYRWVDTFFVEGKGTELVGYQSEKVVATSEMCLSCHDGSVKDSRSRVNENSQHKTNVRPPDNMHIPDVFPLDENGKMQCSTCHTAHGVPSGPGSEEKIFMRMSNRDSAMCLMCHQEKNDKGKSENHPLGPVGMIIPEKFNEHVIVTGDKSKHLVCESCHIAHGSPYQNFLVESNQNSTICYACHKNKNLLSGSKHDMKVSAPDEKNLQGSTTAQAGVCSACHLPHSPARKLEGKADLGTRLCLSCHSKGKIAEKLPLNFNTHPVDANPFEIMKKDFSEVSIKEDNFDLPLYNMDNNQVKKGRMKCMTCHEVHGTILNSPAEQTGEDSENKKKDISFFRKKPSEICRECHRNKYTITGSKHNLEKRAPEIRNSIGKSPSESGSCGICHLLHGQKKGILWTRETVIEDRKVKLSMCESCHFENGISKKKINLLSSHPVNIPLSENINASSLPFFDVEGNLSENGMIVCFSCHDPHRPEQTMTEEEIISDDEGGEKSIYFLRKPSREICVDCHQTKSTITGSKHDIEKTAPESKNVLDQTPSQAGLCSNCHLAHKGQQPFLWARDLDIKTENPVEDLCMSCHNEQGSASKKLIKDYSHQVNISLADKGLATTLPLFDKNGKKNDQGVVTCATCHEPHQWNPLKNTGGDNIDLDGNAEDSFLRLEASPSPRLCENCHSNKSYIKNTDHDLRASEPSFRNILDQTPAESGVCGVCHIVHNSPNWINLWALKLDWQGNINDLQCTSCHSGNGIADNKVPEISSHPEEVKINTSGMSEKDRREFFPVFHKSYGELVTSGPLSCPSCHNAHRWEMGSAEQKDGWTNLEGDAMNSFLRARAAMLPCMNCHGPEGLYRYKFFHSAKSRKKKTP